MLSNCGCHWLQLNTIEWGEWSKPRTFLLGETVFVRLTVHSQFLVCTKSMCYYTYHSAHSIHVHGACIVYHDHGANCVQPWAIEGGGWIGNIHIHVSFNSKLVFYLCCSCIHVEGFKLV